MEQLRQFGAWHHNSKRWGQNHDVYSHYTSTTIYTLWRDTFLWHCLWNSVVTFTPSKSVSSDETSGLLLLLLWDHRTQPSMSWVQDIFWCKAHWVQGGRVKMNTYINYSVIFCKKKHKKYTGIDKMYIWRYYAFFHFFWLVFVMLWIVAQEKNAFMLYLLITVSYYSSLALKICITQHHLRFIKHSLNLSLFTLSYILTPPLV
jgi:hypothetical protein